MSPVKPRLAKKIEFKIGPVTTKENVNYGSLSPYRPTKS